MLILKTPTKLFIDSPDSRVEEIKKLLTYESKTAFFEYKRFKKARWFLNKFGDEAFNARLSELKNKIQVCLLFDQQKFPYVYSGLLGMLLNAFPDESFRNEVEYPDFGTIPWNKEPKYELRYYQKESVEKLLAARHAGIELATGSGKSKILIQLVKDISLHSVIMVPSVSIARQFYSEMVERFGSKKVGLVGDGKKDFKKQFVIGIAASLTRIKKDSFEWQHLSRAKVFLVDEAHLCPSQTLSEVCFGLCANIPYRFFVSGTQIRSDGKDLELEGITGPIVYRKDVKELVNEKFLAKPNFKMVRSISPSAFISDDYQDMVNKHFYTNSKLALQAVDLANKSVELLNHKVLILIEHIEQFKYLYPHIKHEFGFAHGGVTKDNQKYVDERFWKSDPQELVEKFNEGKLPILIGTSCISIGTDIRPVDTVINLQAGSSEIKIRQAVGRGTRLAPGKTEFNYIDFRVELPNCNSDDISITRHADIRWDIYKEIYDNLEFINDI